MVKTVIHHFDRAHDYGKDALGDELSMIHVPWEVLVSEFRTGFRRYHVEFCVTDDATREDLRKTLQELAYLKPPTGPA